MENTLPQTLQQAMHYFADEMTCIEFLASLRWDNGVAVCPKCQCDQTCFLKTRKVWKCKGCSKQFSIKTGSIFEGSSIKLDKWLIGIWMISTCKNGVSSYEIHRALGMTQKSAWFLLHRIRTAMTSGSFEKLSGSIEADESHLGANARSMHAAARKRRGVRQGSPSHKTCVFGMIQRGGKVRAVIVRNRNKETLREATLEHIEPGSELITDEWHAYKNLRDTYTHQIVNHSVEYVRGNLHTNSIENFWSVLKRGIKGTYISISPEHLQKYISEQMLRYNERQGTDLDRFIATVKGITGKRLTYRELIGNYLPA